MSKLQEAIYKFLREGDEHTLPPEQFNYLLRMDLGRSEHKYLAMILAAWLERNYTVSTIPPNSGG